MLHNTHTRFNSFEHLRKRAMSHPFGFPARGSNSHLQLQPKALLRSAALPSATHRNFIGRNCPQTWTSATKGANVCSRNRKLPRGRKHLKTSMQPATPAESKRDAWSFAKRYTGLGDYGQTPQHSPTQEQNLVRHNQRRGIRCSVK